VSPRGDFPEELGTGSFVPESFARIRRSGFAPSVFIASACAWRRISSLLPFSYTVEFIVRARWVRVKLNIHDREWENRRVNAPVYLV
jgi:hypothetical protein